MFSGLSVVHGLASGLGIGLLGLFGLLREAREAVGAVVDLAEYLRSEALDSDTELYHRADAAFEETADVLAKLPGFRRYAKRLRGLL